MRTTFMAKPGEVDRKWYVIVASGGSFGRFSSDVASILRGKFIPLL
ncbi:50S ribosomal protein L13, partial [Listeria monocytogenes]